MAEPGSLQDVCLPRPRDLQGWRPGGPLLPGPALTRTLTCTLTRTHTLLHTRVHSQPEAGSPAHLLGLSSSVVLLMNPFLATSFHRRSFCPPLSV